MSTIVDTNVILVANNEHYGVSPKCVIECIDRLQNLMKLGSVVIDDAYKILSEYQNKTSPMKAKQPGDVFVRWILRNSSNQLRVERVAISETAVNEYAEIDSKLHGRLDPSDRKFVAVALAHPDIPEILQATDCKWIDWVSDLQSAGVTISFVCPDDICKFYSSKFPNKPIPSMK